MAARAQDKLRQEPINRATLTAYGPEDLTAQGFAQSGVFDAIRYNFGNGSIGTFGGLGAPQVGDNAIEVTVDAWTRGQMQYLTATGDGLCGIRINIDNSITLIIGGVSGTWSAHASFATGETTLRFERDGAFVKLRIWVSDVLIDHPDGALPFPTDLFTVDTLSRTASGLVRHYFNGVDNELNKTSGGDWNWRGANDGSYIEWKTAEMLVDGSWRAWMGNSIGSSSNADDDTALRFRKVGNDLEVEFACRNGAIILPFPAFDCSAIDFNKQITWRIERKVASTNVVMDGIVMTSGAGQSSLDMRIDQIGHSVSRGGTLRYQGFLWGVNNTGTDPVVPNTQVLLMDEGTGNTCVSTGTYAGNWTIANVAHWQDSGSPCTGELYELFLGVYHWAMNEGTGSLMAEDAFDSGRDITVSPHNEANWIDHGNGSTVSHTEADGVLGAAFVLGDSNTGLRPSVTIPFEQHNFDRMREFGTALHTYYRYPNTLASGAVLGGVFFNWDYKWQDRAYLDLNGTDQHLEGGASYNIPNGSNMVVRADVHIIDPPSLGDDFPIWGANPSHASQSMFGLVSTDAGNGGGQMYQATVRNFGGYEGANGTISGYSFETNLPAGNYSVQFETVAWGTTDVTCTVWDLDVDSSDKVVNGTFDTDLTGWAVNNANYTAVVTGGRVALGTTSTGSPFCGINNKGVSGNEFLVEVGKTYRYGFDYTVGVGADTGIRMRLQIYNAATVIGGGTADFIQTAQLNAGDFGSEIGEWTPTYTELGLPTDGSGGETALVYVTPTDSRPYPPSTPSADPTAYTTFYDNVFFEDTGQMYKETSVTGVRAEQMSVIGRSNASDKTIQYAKGRISNFYYEFDGNVVYDMPIDDGVGSTITNNGTGVDMLAVNTTNDDWTWLNPINRGLYLETRAGATATDMTAVLKRDSGDISVPIAGVDKAVYGSLVASVDPADNMLRISLNGTPIPQFNVTDWEYSGTEMQTAPVFSNFCGIDSEVGSAKNIKLNQILEFTGTDEMLITSADFLENKIIQISGVRPVTLILERDDDLLPGATVTWECAVPATVIVKRRDTESFVLVNLVGTPATFNSSSRGTILCGNVDSVENYTAFFVNGLANGTVTPG